MTKCKQVKEWGGFEEEEARISNFVSETECHSTTYFAVRLSVEMFIIPLLLECVNETYKR